MKGGTRSRSRRIACSLLGLSIAAGALAAQAQDAYLCVWRNPERTMTRIFPNARDYVSVNARISAAQRKEIESRLGFELLPGQQDLFQYFTMTGENGEVVGTIIPVSQKGGFGAIELVFGLDNDLVIKDLYVQRSREKDQRFKERAFLDLFVNRKLSEALTLDRLYKGEATPGTSAVIRGLKKELVAYEVLVLRPAAEKPGAAGR